MPDSEHMLFPCTVLPDTPGRANFRAHALSFVVAAALSVVLLPLTFATLGVGTIAVLSLWVGVLYRPSARNCLVGFERRRQKHWGFVAPPETVGPLGPRRLAIALLLATAVPFAGVVVASCILTRHFRSHTCATGVSFRDVLRRHGALLFEFLAYPDERVCATGGTAAMWIPRESMSARLFYAVGRLLPYYAAIGVPVVLLFPTARWLAVLAAALAMPLPLLTMTALTMRSLHQLHAALRGTLQATDTEWSEAVSRVSTSTYQANGVALAEHLFLGWVLPSFEQAYHPFLKTYRSELPCRTPALVPLSALDGHAHQSGPAQSGKTSNGQVGILTQLIRGRLCPVLGENGAPCCGADGEALWMQCEPSPILEIDLKGDLALFNTTREECQRRGQTFRFFTLEQGKATSFFNPITNLRAAPRPVIEFCEMTLNMLDLYHGMQYGASYYGEQSRNLLLKALKSARRVPTSWEELYELLTDTLDRREHRDVFELLGRIFALAQYPVLGPAPDGIDTIHMPSVIERNECVYFWLPALESSMSVISIAKMALFTFIDAARKFNNSGHDRKHAYACLDEAQVVAGMNMERVFQQASGARIRMILSNQSLANLDTRDAPNLGKTIWTNTRVKQTFGLLDSRERRDWIDLSGEDIGWLTSVMNGQSGENPTRGVTEHEVVHTRLNQNAISEVNNSAGQSLLYVNGDAGLSRFECVPRQVWCPYPMTYAEYLRRSQTPWPTQSEPQVQGGAVKTTVVNAQAPEEIQQQADTKYAGLEQLFRDVAKQSSRGGPIQLGE